MRRYILNISVLAIAVLLVLSACAASQTTLSPTVPAATATVNTLPAQDSPAATSSGTAANAGASGDALTCVLVPASSVAQYKVREQLARLNFPTDAIGKTQDLTGTIAFKSDGSIDQTASKFVVGLASLQTDESMRDNYVRRNILQTDQYPQAVFVPTQAVGFPLPLPQSGKVAFKLTGNLTIKDVTKPVTFDVTGTIQNNSFTGVATTSFKFEDFNLPQPQVPVVLSVVDNINLELDITMQRAQN